jgi:hypothetical protein
MVRQRRLESRRSWSDSVDVTDLRILSVDTCPDLYDYRERTFWCIAAPVAQSPQRGFRRRGDAPSYTGQFSSPSDLGLRAASKAAQLAVRPNYDMLA